LEFLDHLTLLGVLHVSVL